MKIKSIVIFFCIALMLGSLNSCGSREETVSCFPTQPINVVLNLTLPEYRNKLINDGWMDINEQQSGTRGLILVMIGDILNPKFKVYDKNAPHICPDTNTTLEVKGFKIVCPKDGAEWILFDGTPLKNARVPPKTYPVSYNPLAGEIYIYY